MDDKDLVIQRLRARLRSVLLSQKIVMFTTPTEEERRNLSQGNGGQMNPTWVEWLMGYPIGWTELNA